MNLTPFIPLSFEGEGEVWALKGLRPFKLPFVNVSYLVFLISFYYNLVDSD